MAPPLGRRWRMRITHARVSRQQVPGAHNGYPAAINGLKAGFGRFAHVGGQGAVGHKLGKWARANEVSISPA